MRSSVAVAGLLVALVTTSCTGGDEGDPGTTEGPTSGATGQSSAQSSAPSSQPASDPEPSASTPASADVTPAVGERRKAPGFTFVLPDGFTGSDGNSLSSQYVDQQLGLVVTAGQVPAVGTPDLDQASASLLRTDPERVRQPDREVGGEQVYVVTLTPTDATNSEYLVGRGLADRAVDLRFVYTTALTSQADAMASIESILATVQWDQ